MYNNFFNPFFVSSDIQFIQTNFKTTLKSAMEDQNDQNIQQVIALIRCFNLALDIPPLAQELTNNFNAQNLLEIAQIKLAKFITTEYGNELQLLLHKLQSDNRQPSPYNILEIMQFQKEEILYIFIRLLRIQLLYFDVNRQLAYDYFFFYKEAAIQSQLYEQFIQFLMQQLTTLPKEYKDRFIDILIYLNRQSQEISEQLLKKEIIDQFLQICQDPLYTKRSLILIRDLLETSEETIIEIESTSEILFNLLKTSKDNKQIVQLISQIISKIQPIQQQQQQQQQHLSINDNQMLEDQIDQICFQMLQQTFEYDVQFVDQLIQIIYKEDCSENIYLSTSFLIEKYLADMNSPQRVQISEASYKLIVQNQNPRVCQAYLQLLQILNTQYMLSIKIDFLDTMRELHQDNMKILRQLDDLQRKKKKKFNKFNNQDFESIESFTSFSMNRSMQIRKSSQGPNKSEQEDNELDQIIKLTFKKDELFVTVDCFKYLLEAQKVNQDIVLQYLEQIIDVFLLYPLENTIRELAITLFDTINPQEFISHMVQDIESYDEYTLKLIAGLSLYPKYFDYYTIEKILNFMLQFIIMKIEGNHLNYILIICYNLNLKQPQLIHYIYSVADKNQLTPIKSVTIALAILHKQKYQTDITNRILQLQEQLIGDLEEEIFYSQNCILLEQYVNLLSIQKDKSKFLSIVRLHLQYIQYEDISIDKRLMILTIIRQLIMQSDPEQIIKQTPYLFITFYILKNSNDYIQINTNLIFTDRFRGYYKTLSTIILANQENVLFSEMFILQFLNQTVENTIQSFQLLDNKFLYPTLIFIQDTITIFDHEYLLPLLQSLIEYACESIVSTSVLIPIWQILLTLFDQPPAIQYYQNNYPNNKLPEIGFKRDEQLANLTILLLKKLAVDEKQIQIYEQLAIEQNIIKEEEEEQTIMQEELNENQNNQLSDQEIIVQDQNQKNDEQIVADLLGQQQSEYEITREDIKVEQYQQRQETEVLTTAIIADREIQQDDRRQEDRQIDRTERRQDEVIATAIIADRQIQQDDRRQEDRQNDRAERRQDEVLATAIIADREIQQDDRRQEDRQIDRAERRQDEVIATAIIADREIQQDDRRQEDRQIDRAERRQDEVLATAIIADREIQQDDRRQEDRKIDRAERRQDEVIATAIIADREIQQDDRRQENRQIDRAERRQDEVIATAIIADRQIQQDDRRQEDRQIDRAVRRQDEVIATAIIADREIQQDDRRQEDRQIDRAERRQDEVLATAIIADREIQQDDRRQEDRQIDRAERRQDEVIATAIIADREIQQDDRRQEDRKIDRAERRQDEVIATAIIADREIQQDDRRQENRQIDRAERRQDEVIATAIIADRQIQQDDRRQEDRQIDRAVRRQDEVIATAIIADREIQQDDRRQEDRQIDRAERRQDEVLATAIIADREIQQDDRRQEDRKIDRAERRQDEVIATAIIADREIQQDDRRQEDRQIDRAERRQDEVLATAIIADREIKKDDRRQEDRQIDRAERRQDAVLATALIAEREIQKDDRRQEDRQLEKVQREDDVLITSTLAGQNQDAFLTPTLTGVPTIDKEGDWAFENLYDIATALDMVIGNIQLMNKLNQISQAIQTLITNEQQALNCHQIHILNKLLILQQTEETQKCIQQILQFKKSSKMSENLIQWQLIKITEINLQILLILKSTNQIDSMISRLIGQKEIIPLINSLETMSDLGIIKLILECLDAYCISERVANFFGQYNIVSYVEKWINTAPVEVYLLIGSLCLSNKLQSNFIERKIYQNILKTIESKETQLLANSFYALSGLCFESMVSLEIFSQRLSDIMLDHLSKQCDPIVLETMCAFISNIIYKNDKFKQQMRIFIAPLMNQIQRQNQVLVIQQILRAISNLIYIKENAQIADNQKILEIIKPLLNTPQCICYVLDLYSNLGAHQYLKKDIVLVVIDIIQRNLNKTNILSSALDTLNTMASQYSGFILEHLELILDLTTQSNQEIIFKSYRLISNLVPKHREFFIRNNIIGKLTLHNNTKIDHYYDKMVQVLDRQQKPKLVAPKLLENPYDKLHSGYSIIFFREDGSSIFCELKITTNKEIFAVQADGYLNEKYRIRFLMEMNFNVPKTSKEYQICSKNSLFRQQQFFVLKGKEQNNKNINVIQGQVMSVSLKQELYEVLSLIFK